MISGVDIYSQPEKKASTVYETNNSLPDIYKCVTLKKSTPVVRIEIWPEDAHWYTLMQEKTYFTMIKF